MRLSVLEEWTGRSPSEILVSGASYADDSESRAERRALASELMAVRPARERHDEFPEEARTALDRVRVIAERVNATVEGLGR